MNVTNLIQLAIAVIAAMLTYAVVPWLKAKQTAQQMDDMLKWVDIAVAAAEQLFDSGRGKEKKAAVLAFLREKGLRFDENEIDSAIEAAVLRLHKELGDGNNG